MARHNKAMEKKAFLEKSGKRLHLKFKTLQKVKIPFRPLSQYDLISFVKKLKIPDFRGIYMRDTLPDIPLNIECGILNLDLNDGNGTHWTSWYKSN